MSQNTLKVGVTLWFQNMPDMLERGMKDDYRKPIIKPDFQCYQDELKLADLIEPLGFDRMWTIEHHCSPYGMTVTPTQVLSYMAGRTKRIGFGSMVIVLPWNDPVRVAGEIALLDNLMAGREFKIGVGRGAAPQEFAAFRTDYAESRERMLEILDIIRIGLTQEWFSYDGKHYKIPRTTIRPRPLTTDLTSQFLMTWSSPETRQLAAQSGCAPLYNNLHNWDEVVTSMAEFNGMRHANGWDDLAPTVAGPIYCSYDKEKVRQAREWVKMTYDSSIWHYGLFNQPSLRKFLAGKTGKELEEAIEEIRGQSLLLGAFGTPEEVLERLVQAQAKTKYAELICHMNFGLMPNAEAQENMTLFAQKVLPELKKLKVGNTASVPFAEVERARKAQMPEPTAA